MRLVLSAPIMLVIAAGCAGTPTDDGPPRYPLGRTWEYTADQSTPDRIRIAGDVAITFQSGLRFDGAVDVVETDASGQGERRTGLLSGRFRDSLHVDFDVRLDVEVRRHVGRIGGDSLAGEWTQVSGTSVARGTFLMRRIPSR